MTRLETLLRRREGAAISAIGGMGGVGKTALAIQVAHRVKDDFPDGQVVVNLRGFDPEREPLTSAEAMRQVIAWLAPEAKLPDDEDQLRAAYHGLFEGKRAWCWRITPPKQLKSVRSPPHGRQLWLSRHAAGSNLPGLRE